jgi:hypothetical protein
METRVNLRNSEIGSLSFRQEGLPLSHSLGGNEVFATLL